MIALFIGPAGMAVTGNLRNFLVPVDALTTLGMQNGIIKYTAESERDKERLKRILATTFITIGIAVVFFMLLLLLTVPYWSVKILGNAAYSWVFNILAVTLPLYTGNLVFVAVLNGLGKFKQVIYLNTWGNIVGVLSTAVLIWSMGLSGALLGITIYPSVLFVFSAYYMHKSYPGFTFLKNKYFDKVILKGLLSYSFMSLITVLLSPFIFISIRNNLIEGYGADEAGFWDAVNRIASFYLMFASTMLTVYFLPKLSVAKSNSDTKAVFLSYYKLMIPVFLLGLGAIYILRVFIIRLLFSKEFLPVADLFMWQLIGDFFKICSLILGFQFFAKKMTKAFIVTEVISLAILYSSSIYLVHHFGSEGAVMAHALTYILYFIVLVLYFRKKLF